MTDRHPDIIDPLAVQLASEYPFTHRRVTLMLGEVDAALRRSGDTRPCQRERFARILLSHGIAGEYWLAMSLLVPHEEPGRLARDLSPPVTLSPQPPPRGPVVVRSRKRRRVW